MKREVKPFVVEVKRGKRRQSFLGQVDEDTSTMSEATRRAELALFAGAGAERGPSKASPAEPAGRILPSLIEAPEPEVEAEEVQPRRRGRKPGSKNKPKPATEPTSQPSVEAASPPGRPEAGGPAAAPPPAAPVEDGPSPASADTPVPERRHRLRDRSKILARYVHRTSPAPGEGWMRRTRRFRWGRLVSPNT